MKKAIAVGIILFGGALVAWTQAAAVWQPIGPAGGWIRALATNPKNAREVYAAVQSYPSQVFKSSDSGLSWKRIGMVSAYLIDLTVHPTNPNVLYGTANSALYTSKDQGKTFTILDLPNPTLIRLDGNISISPRKPETIYVSGCCRTNTNSQKYCMAVFRSKDGGRTWTVHKLEPVSDDASEPQVAASPARSEIVYAAGSYRKSGRAYHRVFKSADGGNTWKNVTGSIDRQPYDLLLDPRDPNKVYIVTDFSVYRSSDGGATWTTVPVSSKRNSMAYAVARDPANPNTLYIGGDSGAWKAFLCKSTNGGASWTDITNGMRAPVIDIAVDPVSPKIVYVATWGSAWKSEDGGVSWTELSVRWADTLIINPKNPNELFAGTGYSGVYYSADQGATWQDFSADLDIKNVEFLDMDPVARILYAGTYGSGIVKRRF